MSHHNIIITQVFAQKVHTVMFSGRYIPLDVRVAEAKRKRQATLHRYLGGQSTWPTLLPATKKKSAAESIGVRLYSEAEVDAAGRMTKQYYCFWNAKAEELSSDEDTLLKLKRILTILYGAIHRVLKNKKTSCS